MSRQHSQFQQAFAEALFAPEAVVDPVLQKLVAQPAFAVYRNTVMKACVDALEANFPAVARLVGRDWFRAAATVYVVAEGPCDPRLLHYGKGFAEFLRAFEPASELVYLPGVARIDTLWCEAHVAQNAQAADAGWISRYTAEQIATIHLRPHPATRWAWFDDQPIYSIWERNRRPDETVEALLWRGEGVLLTRPGDTVGWCAITKGGCAFLDACADGLPLASVAGRVLLADPDADLAATFETLLRSSALVESPQFSGREEGRP